MVKLLEMNTKTDLTTDIKRDIVLRAECNEILKLSKGSTFPRELYSALRLFQHKDASILCIGMSARGKYIGEIMLNKEHVFRAVKLMERLRSFSEQTQCKLLYIAVSTDITDTVFPSEIFKHTMERVTLAMESYCVSVEYKIFCPEKVTGEGYSNEK